MRRLRLETHARPIPPRPRPGKAYLNERARLDAEWNARPPGHQVLCGDKAAFIHYQSTGTPHEPQHQHTQNPS